MTLSKTKKPKASPRNQRARFVHDAIARSLLTLPFAHLDVEDPFGTLYGHYKALLELAEAGELPSLTLLAQIVELVSGDAATHEAAGNYMKAEIERQWCEGLWLYFGADGRSALSTSATSGAR
ncbi:MAG TPA: hypothetical protein VLE97_11125 [Gaiellaceae bacterium]|nr:hypothetical protein [Gaiellaceae bacterium]